MVSTSNGEHQLSISFAAEWLQTEYRPLSSPLESGISPFIYKASGACES